LDLRKYYFTNGTVKFEIVCLIHCVLCDTVNKFASQVDKSWQTKILNTILNLKFTELEAEVCIIKTTYRPLGY